jgi:hypothetical protein
MLVAAGAGRRKLATVAGRRLSLTMKPNHFIMKELGFCE